MVCCSLNIAIYPLFVYMPYSEKLSRSSVCVDICTIMPIVQIRIMLAVYCRNSLIHVNNSACNIYGIVVL